MKNESECVVVFLADTRQHATSHANLLSRLANTFAQELHNKMQKAGHPSV